MREAKHMSGLMREDLTTPPKHKRLTASGGRFAVKCWMITGEAINADALVQRCLAKNKIPRRFRIKVFHRNREHAKRVRRHAALKKIEHIAGQDLSRACGTSVRIVPGGKLGRIERYPRRRFDFDCEKRCG